MARPRTHYDNLRVTRNAPKEVIRAAYRSLSQKYHPDRNPGDPEATRIMAIINASYEVLSDAERRKAHDAWIDQQEQKAAEADSNQNVRGSTNESHVQRFNQELSVPPQRATAANYAFLVTPIVLILALGAYSIGKHSRDAETPPATYYSAPPVTSMETSGQDAVASPNLQDMALNTPPVYARPEKAPNGNAWPKTSGYVAGYPRKRNSGHSTIEVDNQQSTSDVYVKLFYLGAEQPVPVRHFVVRAGSTFTLKKVEQGTYDLRYMDLDSGARTRMTSFVVNENETFDAINYSEISVTLYEVSNGNVESYPISESEFGD